MSKHLEFSHDYECIFIGYDVNDYFRRDVKFARMECLIVIDSVNTTKLDD